LIFNSVFAGLSKRLRISPYKVRAIDPLELVPLLPIGDKNLEKHLALEQFWHDDSIAVRRRNRRSTCCSVKFQFVWYEIVYHSGREVGRHSGGLYRDDKGRKLQLQSFLVSDFTAWSSDQVVVTNK